MVLNKRLNIIFPFLLTLLNAIALGGLFWSCNRGFNLSDESYYLLGYLFYDNNPDLYPASFHMVFNRLFSSFNTLTEIRTLRLFLTIIASIVLYFGSKSVLHSKSTTDKFILFNVVLSGMLLSYTWAPLTLSYNTMSSILIALIVGLWLFLITRKKAYTKALFACALGGLFSILFFVKITNLLLLPILIVITGYLVFKKKLTKQVRPKFAVYYFLSFVLGTYISLAFITNDISFANIQQTIYKYVQESFGVLANDSTHTTSYLLNRYYKNAKMVLTELKYPLAFLILLYFFLRFFWTKIKLKTTLESETIFKIVGLITITLLIIQNDYWKGGTKVTYTMLFIYILLMTLALLNGFLEKKRQNLILLFAMLSIPIAGAAGTNNGLSAQVLFYGVFIFLAIYYLVSSLKNNYFKNAVLAILIGIGTSQILYATIYYPYQQPPLTASTHKLEGVKALSSLKVDAALAHVREELSFLEQNTASYIFAYSEQRGMVLFANKKPYSLEWFHENDLQKICSVVNKSQIDPEDIIFLLPSQAPLQKEVIECMEKNGVYFEKNYSQAKSVTYYDQYYQIEISLNIYIPASKKN